MTGKDAAETAVRAGAEQLVLTHIPPWYDRSSPSTRRARSSTAPSSWLAAARRTTSEAVWAASGGSVGSRS